MVARISMQQWNRTLLHRQYLDERADEDAIDVIDRCVGLQSQDPQAAFYALASRIEGFDPAELDDLLVEREIVRLPLQRGTVFLMDGLDSRWMREVLQPVLDAGTRSHVRRFVRVTANELASAATELVSSAEAPVSGAALRQALLDRWPNEPGDAMMAVVRGCLPLVQTPPRGLWRQSGAPAFAMLDEWLGVSADRSAPNRPDADAADRASADTESVRDLIRMYLRGFGPSTVAGIQAWSGLRGLRPILEAMEVDWEVESFVGPNEEKLYDLDGLGLSEPEATVPVRFIAPFDNVVFSQADRIRVADADVYSKTLTPNGKSPGFILVDGRLAGTWRISGKADGAGGGIELTELVDLQPAQRRECEREANLMAAFGA